MNTIPRRVSLLVILVCAAILWWKPWGTTVNTQGAATSPSDSDQDLTEVSSAAQPSAQTSEAVQSSPQTSFVPDDMALGAATPAPGQNLEIEAMRSAARTALSSIYAAQLSFFNAYGRYTTDLFASGWRPPDQTLKLKVGFTRSFVPSDLASLGRINEDPNQRMSSDFLVGLPLMADQPQFKYTPEASQLRLSDYERFCEKGCTASVDSFEVLAVIPIPGAEPEVWRINEKKELKRVP